MSNRKIDNLREPSNVHFKVQTGFPTAVDAKEGTLTLRYVSGTGLCLFAYHANRWNMIKLSPMNAKDETIVENLVVKNLEVDKTAKFKSSKIDISDKNLPEIRKWNKSYNDIRSGEVDAKFKKVNATAQISTPEISLRGGAERIVLTNEDGSMIATMDDATEDDRIFKINRDVNAGNPTLQIGSSDTECFKIRAVYNSGAKGLDYVQFVTLTEGGDADDGAMYWLIDNVQQMSLGDDLLDVNGRIDLTSTTADQLKVNYDGSNYGLMNVASDGHLEIESVGTDADMTLNAAGDIEINADGGAITFKDDSTTLAALNSSGDFAPLGHMTLNDDKQLIFGVDTNTYIWSDVDDLLRIVVGGDTLISMFENGADGNLINMGGSVGFTRGTTSHSDTTLVSGGGTHDTDVDFRQTNKQFLELAGNINDLNFVFPNMSGNFVLLLKQDGTGSRTVTNYKAWESATGGTGDAADGSATLIWAGGSNPTLTTTADKTDIISIFWDASASGGGGEKAYATITHNF